MDITLDMVERRLLDLEEQRQQAYARYQAVHGAIQELLYWKSVILSVGEVADTEVVSELAGVEQ